MFPDLILLAGALLVGGGVASAIFAMDSQPDAWEEAEIL